METKKCRDCKRTKAVSEFSISNKRTGLLRPECKKCNAKKWREKHKYTSKKFIKEELGRKKLSDKIKAIKLLLADIEKDYKKMKKNIEKVSKS